MKVKKILSVLVASGLVVASSAFAGNLVSQTNSPSASAIHSMALTNYSYQTVRIRSTFTFGTLHDGVCYLGPTSSPEYFDVASRVKDAGLTLNGDAVKKGFGMKYDCAQWTIIDMNDTAQYTNDKFVLVKNYAGDEYVGSTPSGASFYMY
jgi:hypothetical protein